jgi:predicted AAA+ superfamily ATPase
VFNGEGQRTQKLWESKDIRRLEGLVSGYDIVLLDEAQRIHEAGVSLKVLYDSGFAGKLFVTGSSSLDLASKTREALTGRTWTFTLFPISFAELSAFETGFELDARREGRLP